MRKTFFLVFISVFCYYFQMYASLTGGFDYMVYHAKDLTPYLETYLWIDGKTIQYKTDNNQKEGSIEVTVIISQNGQVAFYDKYGLKTRAYNPSDTLYEWVYDLRRFPIADGTWEFEMILKDVNDVEGLPIEMKDTITVELNKKTVNLSKIQFISYYQKTASPNLFSRGGYDMIPFHDNYFDDNLKKMVFYAELYETDKFFGNRGKFLINYYIENYESGKQLEEYSYRKREIAQPVKSVLAEMDISQLPVGRYNIVLEVRDSLNQFQTRTKKFFERDNKYYSFKDIDIQSVDVDGTFVDRFSDVDSLRQFIRCIKPIAAESEYQQGKNVLKNGDPVMMKRFLYAFWIKRNASQPQLAFMEYWKQVLIANENFGTLINKGYDTDRGRVYLKYGPPNAISQRYNEPSAYPYEIWQYWQLKSQTNVRFVFYNKDQVSNDFTLLHSDLRGELNNRQWELFLFQRNNSFSVDDENIFNQFGNWSKDLYNNPR